LTRRDTKSLICEVARELFNLQGTANVSTNHVALELDMSPGNLYYHFRNKEAILDRLLAQYLGELKPYTNSNALESDIEDAWFFIHMTSELATRYRFIYRDTDYILGKYPPAAQAVSLALTSLLEAITRLLTGLDKNGALQLPSDQAHRDLAMNMLIVCTQWIRFRRHLAGKAQVDVEAEDLNAGVYQTLSIVMPYLEPSQRQHLENLRGQYT